MFKAVWEADPGVSIRSVTFPSMNRVSPPSPTVTPAPWSIWVKRWTRTSRAASGTLSGTFRDRVWAKAAPESSAAAASRIIFFIIATKIRKLRGFSTQLPQ